MICITGLLFIDVLSSNVCFANILIKSDKNRDKLEPSYLIYSFPAFLKINKIITLIRSWARKNLEHINIMHS